MILTAAAEEKTTRCNETVFEAVLSTEISHYITTRQKSHLGH